MAFDLEDTPNVTIKMADNFTLSPKLRFNAMASPSGQVQDLVNKTINLAGIVVHTITMNDNDGNPRDTPRIVLIDDSGETYAAMSFTLMTQLTALWSTVLSESWSEPIPIRITETSRNGKRYFGIELP